MKTQTKTAAQIVSELTEWNKGLPVTTKRLINIYRSNEVVLSKEAQEDLDLYIKERKQY